MISLVMVYRPIEIKTPPFPLLYVGGALKKAGYEVEVIHCTANEMDKYVDKIVAKKPDFVGFSVLTGLPTLYSAEMSQKIKNKSDIPIVWGGIHPSILPQQCLQEDYIDIVVIGEGEETTVELAQRLKNKKSIDDLKGIGFKTRYGDYRINLERTFINELDKYRMDFQLVDLERYIDERITLANRTKKITRSIGYITSRGCPFSCAFCYNQAFNKRQWRAYSMSVIEKDIEFLKNTYGVNRIQFWDDNFFANKGRAIEILKKIEIPSGLDIRIDSIDEELARKFNDLSVDFLLIGAESGSDRILRLMDKKFDSAQTLEKVKILAKYNINTLYSFILAVPTETKEELEQTLDFMLKIHRLHKESSFTIGMYQPYPGTELYKLAVKEGFRSPETTEEWNLVDRWRNTVTLPWIEQKKALHIRLLFAILGWNWRLVNKWIEFRIKHRIFGLSHDIKILILVNNIRNRIFSINFSTLLNLTKEMLRCNGRK